MIEISNVSKTYQMGDTPVHALQDVSLHIGDGEFVAIMGPSGSGKSTLLQILGLLDRPDSGSYKLAGREVANLSDTELAGERRKRIGFVFQQFNLLTRSSAEENVSLPLIYSLGHHDLTRAKDLLSLVDLGQRSRHKPGELSGGQQQRVAIARALVNSPAVILADEPTGNLDSVSEREIMRILTELNAQGITVVIVTHELEIGMKTRRIIKMRDGRVHSDERNPSFEALPETAQTDRPKLLGDPPRRQGRFLVFGGVWSYFSQAWRSLSTLR